MNYKIPLFSSLYILTTVALFGLFGCAPTSTANHNQITHQNTDDIDSIEHVYSDGIYTIRYQFEKDFCNTDIHEVHSNSQSDVIDNFCAELNDNKTNHSCAREIRQRHFKEYCTNLDRPSGLFSDHDRHLNTIDSDLLLSDPDDEIK